MKNLPTPDLKFLWATPVTHRQNGVNTERWHWQLDTWYGFSFRGDGPNLGGWATKIAAKRAGLKTMRAYLRRIGRLPAARGKP